MTRIVFYSLGFALALVLCAAPLPDALAAGKTVTINDDVGGNVVGNGDPTTTADPFTSPDNYLDPNNNEVIINRGTVDGYVYGGVADSSGGSATATGNSVTVNSGGEVGGYVIGGYASSTGSGSATATATGNSVTISGGEVGSDVYGGYAQSDIGSATATGNSVFITGGRVEGNVYGGYAVIIGNGGSTTATHNTVTINGSPEFDASNTNLYGGYGSTDHFTGNTLNVWNYTGTAVASVQNFQNYNFVLPASLKGLQVTGSAILNDAIGDGDSSIGSTVTGVSTLGGAAPVQPGTPVTLISAAPLDTSNFTQTKAQGKHGATLLYDWTLATSDTALTATLDSVQLNPQAKALSEGFLGGLALTTQGADLVAGQAWAMP